MGETRLIPIEGIPFIVAGDDIAVLIYEACRRNALSIEDGDIIVIAQKIISKAENRIVSLQSIIPSEKAIELANQTGRDPRAVQVYLDEASEILFIKGKMIITKHRLGFKMSNSGVDSSNVAPWEERIVSLIPEDPDKSARKVRDSIRQIIEKNVAVIINDSCGRDERDGSVGMAIGIAGISPLECRNQTDMFGNHSGSRIALIDELAAAASILMGQADEKIPVVIIRGVSYTIDNQADITRILN